MEWDIFGRFVFQAARNSLNNRFLPLDLILTDAVLLLDDDVKLSKEEIEFGFDAWREKPDRIVGHPERGHRFDPKEKKWAYNAAPAGKYSMILTGAAFLHKYYLYAYTWDMPPTARDLVDRRKNCEDIAMNFYVAHLTRKPPIKGVKRAYLFRRMTVHFENARLMPIDEMMVVSLSNRACDSSSSSKMGKMSFAYSSNDLVIGVLKTLSPEPQHMIVGKKREESWHTCKTIFCRELLETDFGMFTAAFHRDVNRNNKQEAMDLSFSRFLHRRCQRQLSANFQSKRDASAKWINTGISSRSGLFIARGPFPGVQPTASPLIASDNIQFTSSSLECRAHRLCAIRLATSVKESREKVHRIRFIVSTYAPTDFSSEFITVSITLGAKTSDILVAAGDLNTQVGRLSVAKTQLGGRLGLDTGKHVQKSSGSDIRRYHTVPLQYQLPDCRPLASTWEEDTVVDNRAESKIVPIFKMDTCGECSNDRGISMTPVGTGVFASLIPRRPMVARESLTLRRTLEGLQNPDVQLVAGEHLVNLEYTDDIVLILEDKGEAQFLLSRLTIITLSFCMRLVLEGKIDYAGEIHIFEAKLFIIRCDPHRLALRRGKTHPFGTDFFSKTHHLLIIRKSVVSPALLNSTVTSSVALFASYRKADKRKHATADASYLPLLLHLNCRPTQLSHSYVDASSVKPCEPQVEETHQSLLCNAFQAASLDETDRNWDEITTAVCDARNSAFWRSIPSGSEYNSTKRPIRRQLKQACADREEWLEQGAQEMGGQRGWECTKAFKLIQKTGPKSLPQVFDHRCLRNVGVSWLQPVRSEVKLKRRLSSTSTLLCARIRRRLIFREPARRFDPPAETEGTLKLPVSLKQNELRVVNEDVENVPSSQYDMTTFYW
ncbi:exostosin-like 3 protein [Clonorchis sinensis]|uniref:Exostosin-like 3 protein n=1 Tax=Clonorchis sinensis TaxID=79923 RepID=G7YLA0_CLOSI|nr:exostosin-like 3 protein [Clonorchis sinensis]